MKKKTQLKSLSNTVASAKKEHDQMAIELKKAYEKRSRPEWSIMSKIEQEILHSFKIEREAYHGGDFNGVCCQRLMEHWNTIMPKVEAMVVQMSGKREASFQIQQ